MSSAALTKSQPAGQISANVATSQLFPNKAVPAQPVTLGVLGSGRLEGKKFTVRASGSLTTASNLTAILTLYMAKFLPANPFTPGNWTSIGGLNAVCNTVTCPFMVEAQLQFESVGGTMQGTVGGFMNNTWTAPAAISNQLTGLNGTSQTVSQAGTLVVAAEPVFLIAVGLLFGTANAGNIATLDDFVLDG